VLAGMVFFAGKEIGCLGCHQRIHSGSVLSLDKLAQHGCQAPWTQHRVHAHERSQRRHRLRRRSAGQQGRAFSLESILVGVSARPALRH